MADDSWRKKLTSLVAGLSYLSILGGVTVVVTFSVGGSVATNYAPAFVEER